MPTIRKNNLTETSVRIVLEPLERGYGQTIGNALRRVLLSSIQGAAVTAVRIDKVFHEFSPIPGIKEDATEFLLNLKDMAIRWDGEKHADEEKILEINIKGPGRVTGADVKCPEGLTIVNPEVYLATISGKQSLKVEMFVAWGRGYVLPDRHEKYQGEIATLPTGSQFTPVRKVNYIIEQTRVGMRTDYERLILEVDTNGAVAPDDAITQASQELGRYFAIFDEVGGAGARPEAPQFEEEYDELSNIEDCTIEDLNFGMRTYNALRRSGYTRLKHIARLSEADLSAIRGFGSKSMKEVKDMLAERGLELRSSKRAYQLPTAASVVRAPEGAESIADQAAMEDS